MNARDLPPLTLLRQQYTSRALGDATKVAAAAHRALAEAGLERQVRRGMRIGVAAGSRGISNYAAIVRAACAYLQSLGAEVFLFPCMGSHGGATAEGQVAVLRDSGITPESMGVPILSDIEPKPLGRSGRAGLDIFMDRHAWEADAFLLVNRIKPHTDFSGRLESGLMKMMAMGIGKHKGAQTYHAYAIRGGRYEEAIREAAGTVLGTGKCLGGVAILEDAFHCTAAIEWVPAQALPGREEELLAQVKQWLARLQVEALDLLIIDELGKNISGAGLDTKVVNRSVHGEANGWPGVTRIERIFLRDLSAHTYGNAVGVGMAEGVTRRLADGIDWRATSVNALTASTPRNIRLPLVFANDREGIVTLLDTVGLASLADARIAWIRNTLEVATLAVSRNLVAEMQAKIPCEVLADDWAWEFDAAGDLLSPFTVPA